MAFPTRNSTAVFSQRWEQLLTVVTRMQTRGQNLKILCDDAGATVTSRLVAQYSDALVGWKADADALVAGANTGSPTFVSYAQSQLNDASLDIVTEWTDLETAYNTLIAWFNSNIPGIGLETFGSGVITSITLSAAQKTAVSTQLGTFLAEFLA